MFIVIIYLSAMVQGLIALFVLLKNHKNLTNVLFFFLSFALITWAVINFIITNDPFTSNQLLLYRFLMFSVVVQNTFFYLFSHTYTIKKLDIGPKKLVPYIILSLLAGIITLSPFLFTNVEYGAGGARPTPGPGMLLFVLHAGISVFSGLRSIYKHYAKSLGSARQQFKLIFYGSLILWGIVPITNFIISLATQTLFFARISPIYTLAFSSVIAYAIVARRLFDIRAVVARSVAYTLLLVTIAGIYATAVFSLTNLLFDENTSATVQNLFYAGLAVVIAFTFQPLKRFFDHITDRLFYQDRYDTQEVLNQLGSILSSQIDLHIIIQSSLDLICRTLDTFHGRLVVLDEGKVYRIAEYQKPPMPINAQALELLHHNLIITDELEEGDVKKLLMQHDIAVSLRLKTQEGVVGYLLLGSKQNGSIYTNQDARFLEILSNELAIAVENARSFEKIADFNITLQQRIKEATKRLAQQNKRLKELDEAKDEFISMASHQLRTPLTAVKGYLSMMAEGDAGKLSPKQDEFTDLAYTSAERMVYLISDMLNVSRISTGKLIIEREPVNLENLVKSEIRQLERTAKARGVILDFKPLRHKLPMLNLDQGKMRQVIMNFLDNAIYYAPKSTVEVYLEEIGSSLRFTVKDHGIGVPKEAQKKLFSKFYRAGNARRARPDGTGLGLYMARMVVEMQGGKIIFSSTEGKGSNFGFEFPLSAVELKPAKKPAIPAAKV